MFHDKHAMSASTDTQSKISVFQTVSRFIPRVCLIFLAICLYCFLCTKIGLDAHTGGPDEGMRSLIPRCIVDGNFFPSGFDDCATYHLGYWSYAFYPQMLAAYLSSFFMGIAKLLGCADSGVFVCGRLASVCFGAICLLAVGSAVSALFRESRYREILACFVVVLLGFWPQFAFLSSYMNNDIAALAGVSLLILALIRGLKFGWSLRNVMILCLGMVIAGLGYWNAYGFILTAAVLFVATALNQHRGNWKSALRLISGAVGLCSLCMMPFFIANFVRYGDFIGMGAFHNRYMQWIMDGGEQLQHPWTEGWKNLLTDSVFVQWTVESFIAVFGYMTTWMPYMVYLFYIVVMSVGIGLFLGRWREWGRNRYSLAFIVAMLAACIITVSLFLYYTFQVDYQPQGRYIIYLLIPLVLAVTSGIGRSMTGDVHVLGSIVMVLFMICYMALCLWCFHHAIAIAGWDGVHWELESEPF